MKKLFISFGLALLATLAGAQPDSFSYIQGKVEGDNAPREIKLLQADRGNPAVYATTRISPTGTFGFAVEASADQPYYYLSDGKNIFRISLQTSSTVKVAWTDGDFRFTDPADKANQVLQKWHAIERPLRSVSKSDLYAAFFPRFDSVAEASKNFLTDLKQSQSPLYAQMEDIVRLDILNDFLSYLLKYQQSYEGEERFSAYYRKIMQSFPETSAALLSQPYGCALMKTYFEYKQTYLYRQHELEMTQQLAEIQNPALRTEYILSDIPTDDFSKYAAYEDRYLPLLPDQDAQNRMRNDKRRPRGGMQPGEQAPNLIFPDADGRLHSMTELRGKWIYVDVWATWCVPCKAEIPYLKELERQYANADIAFVSISIDKNRDAWKKFVADKQLGGMQLWAGDWTAFPEEMNLGSVPRFLIIDPQGKWFDSNAPRPSNSKTKDFFRQKFS